MNNPIDVIFRFRVKPGKLELYKQAIDFIRTGSEFLIAMKGMLAMGVGERRSRPALVTGVRWWLTYPRRLF